jgi:hypothetical protein
MNKLLATNSKRMVAASVHSQIRATSVMTCNSRYVLRTVSEAEALNKLEGIVDLNMSMESRRGDE